ncbi:hypothetical protein O6H91_01G126600 [Diphasiastrum complanatum]|uniref:Uncharacterized protein n=1 Tax=Diphasiastrum complanatum TaxID=34168 RepID=A0ACC2EVS2_DIPCM|nr:hypothetical protein O6H91_01G126600 [Diphasiastrum complanatum]
MAKKRKSDATGLDEVDRTLFSSFCTAAKSISQLYTQAQHHHRIAFHEGERHFVEKLCQWLKDQQRALIAVEDILQFLQDEHDSTNGDEMMMSPAYQSQQSPAHVLQQQQQSLLSVHQTASDIMGHSGLGNVSRAMLSDQSKAYIFSGALSSPSRRGLSPFGSIQIDSAVSQNIRVGSIFEQQTQRDENLDYYVERHNSSSATSHIGSTIYACDPQ